MVFSGHTWKLCCNGAVPQGAAVCGKDKDGSDMYVGRAFHEGDMLPAKIVPKKGGAYVSYGGREHSLAEYEVSKDTGKSPSWPNAVTWCPVISGSAGSCPLEDTVSQSTTPRRGI